MIAQASKDERGRYAGGQAGDQSGTEVYVRSWYSRPWDIVIRPREQALGDRIAMVARRICECPQVGYDQGQRTDLYRECSRIGWDLDRLYEIQPCECDCSSLIAVVMGFCGVMIDRNIWTGNMERALMGTGLFYALADAAYTESEECLRAGDILLNRSHHAAINLDNGPAVTVSVHYSAAVSVSQGSYLTVRTSPEVRQDNIYLVQGQAMRLVRGQVIAICEERGAWGRIMDIQAWVSLKYLVKGG